MLIKSQKSFSKAFIVWKVHTLYLGLLEKNWMPDPSSRT